ncbi:hypothetical protein ACWEEL_39290, partial [Streptomyces sp. NPDC005009]
AAVLLWGLGASLGFPLALSAAGDSGPDPAARVSLVAMIGYVAFLVGPPGLGFLGDHYGLRTAMTVVLAFVAVAVFLAPAVGTRRTTLTAAAPAPPAVDDGRTPLTPPPTTTASTGAVSRSVEPPSGAGTRGEGPSTRKSAPTTPPTVSPRTKGEL